MCLGVLGRSGGLPPWGQGETEHPQFPRPGIQAEIAVAVPLAPPVEHNRAPNQEYVLNCAVGCLRLTMLVHLFAVAFCRSAGHIPNWEPAQRLFQGERSAERSL